ncbi:hypothetical protein [Solibacillus daqui]|uniref:hypothetical protein n=1 Tax=Solibacillus daqui TaxID=2912187 RepID=UPI00236713A3|nr:hypothetical protein [Solibacillus daqui]
MEALIIAIVIGIISSLFKDKNQKQQPNKKPTKQMPPFSSQPAPRKQDTRPDTKQQNRPKTLEDFANEVFGQLNEKTKPVVKKVEPALEVVLPQEVVPKVNERPKMAESTRTLKERPIVEKLKEQSEGLQVVPKNNKELMQAIVMAEVLGPPKARRK